MISQQAASAGALCKPPTPTAPSAGARASWSRAAGAPLDPCRSSPHSHPLPAPHLQDLDAGKLPQWTNLQAPDIGKNYWKLGPDATMRDLLLAIRADEACHM